MKEYRNVAFIPVRGGSKSIPLKNIKEINGKPLIYWTLKASSECDFIDRIYVATDCEKIKNVVESLHIPKVEVIEREANSATDTASTELAMIQFAEKYAFENIVLVQATSPLLDGDALNEGFLKFQSPNVDSVLSVVRQKRFCWEIDERNNAHPINYDFFNRPRRQEFEGYLVENGAFYITSKEKLVRTKSRLSGNIAIVEMDEKSYFEIDEPSDWVIIEKLLQMKKGKSYDIPLIKMFITDCDGCLTDAGMYYSEHGDELKKFNTKDGMGFKLLRESGILVGIVTGENVELNNRRAEKVKVDFLLQGVDDKLKQVISLCQDYNISIDNVAYVGDDINDIELIENVGFGCAVGNAIDAVKKKAKYISERNGGEGAVREIIDLILAEKAKMEGDGNGEK